MAHGLSLWAREKLLALGAYPEVSLKDAREKRDAAKAKLREGIDPGEARKLERLTQASEAAITFRLVAEEYLARQGARKRSAVTQAKNRWLLEQVYPGIGNRPIAAIKAAEVLAVLKTVEQRGRLETARRLRAIIGACSGMPSRRCARRPIRRLCGACVTARTR